MLARMRLRTCSMPDRDGPRTRSDSAWRTRGCGRSRADPLRRRRRTAAWCPTSSATLPGRGVWVTARARRAGGGGAARRVRQRALKRDVRPRRPILPAVTERLLETRRARCARHRRTRPARSLAGFAKVEDALASGAVIAADPCARGARRRRAQDRRGGATPGGRRTAGRRHRNICLGGIGFGTGPVKCDTCCAARRARRARRFLARWQQP